MPFADILIGAFIGFTAFFIVRCVLTGFYTVDQNERAVKTSFGRAERLLDVQGNEIPVELPEEERDRYHYPQLRVIGPGGPYFKFPWEKIWKVSIATETQSIAYDPMNGSANQKGKVIEAVTKDNLNTGLQGQIRYCVSEQNMYAYLFGVKNPVAHVMGFFTSILRERIANFEAPPATDATSSHIQGISINDLRKNLRELNEHMERECHCSSWRYGIRLEAALITEIDPPLDVESALAAINTAHNQVSAEISLAQATADQKIVQSKRAVEIETFKAQGEVEPLNWMATQLTELKKHGPNAIPSYFRNIRLAVLSKAKQIILEMKG
jgi:regulator of protease activity HflC (stomatin/prohibitin superfamily)